jgi:hypothetical protein
MMSISSSFDRETPEKYADTPRECLDSGGSRSPMKRLSRDGSTPRGDGSQQGVTVFVYRVAFERREIVSDDLSACAALVVV